VRYATIAAALAGPIPGKVVSSSSPAVFTLTSVPSYVEPGFSLSRSEITGTYDADLVGNCQTGAIKKQAPQTITTIATAVAATKGRNLPCFCTVISPPFLCALIIAWLPEKCTQNLSFYRKY